MVTSLFNLLQATSPKAPVNSPAPTAKSADNGRQFARMVDDASAERARPTGRTESANASTLRAQEPRNAERRVSAFTPDQAAADTTEETPKITPQVANALLSHWEEIATAADAQTPAGRTVLDQVKAKLASISQGGTPATMETILAETGVDVDAIAALLPQPQPAATAAEPEPQNPLLALLPPSVTAQPEAAHAPEGKGLLATLSHLMQRAKQLAGGNAAPVEAAAVTDIPTPALPATDLASALPADDKKLGAEEAEQPYPTGETVQVITPLSNTLVLVANNNAAPAPTSPTAAATAAPVESVEALDLSRKAASVDTLIPSLALSKDEKTNALPDVELPNTHSAKQATAPAAAVPAEAASATAKPLSEIERQLQALDNAVSAMPAKEETTAKVEQPDATQPQALTLTSASGVTAPQAAASIQTVAANAINHAPVREQVQVAITKAAQDGTDQITIQLDPLGLGRVEVKMHVAQDGQTHLAFLVDKPETFDALSRDARGLERSLQEAGLKADTGGMQFNLRQQPQQMGMQSDTNSERQQHAQQGTDNTGTQTTTTASVATPITRHYRVDIQDGIDIHA